MKTKSTFTSAEWDFTTIGNINEGVTYPFFQESVLIVSPTMQGISHQVRNDTGEGEREDFQDYYLEIFFYHTKLTIK